MDAIDHMPAVRERPLFTNRSAMREVLLDVVRVCTNSWSAATIFKRSPPHAA
jgi:hypothetical protein